MNAVFAFCMISAGGGVLFALALRTSTYDMLHDELVSKWGLKDGVDAPVFVGEFGEGHGHAGGQYWTDIMRFLREYDLDWAYWPINGDVWNEDQQRWDDEWYGILDQQYAAVRDSVKLADLQGVQEPSR